MGLYEKLKAAYEIEPRNRVIKVKCRNNGVDLSWKFGSFISVDTNEFRRVTIRTTDAGPYDVDVFYIIDTETERYVIPRHVADVGKLPKFLEELPGFDLVPVIESTSCSENKDFICWEKAGEDP